MLDQLYTESLRERDIHDCLRLMWRVQIDGKEVDLKEFLPAGRFDSRMRGLIGAIPPGGLEPGVNALVVTWNRESSIEESRALGARYQLLVTEVQIPFLFNPSFERTLESRESP